METNLCKEQGYAPVAAGAVDVSDSQIRRLQRPNSRLEESQKPSLVELKARHLYEIDHKLLPPISPFQLKFIRVVMVVQMSEQNITVRFPSMQALRGFFSGLKSQEDLVNLPDKTTPLLDEQFVMGAKIANVVLRRLIKGHEFIKQKDLQSFWCVPSNISEPSILKMEDGNANDETSVQGLKCGGLEETKRGKRKRNGVKVTKKFKVAKREDNMVASNKTTKREELKLSCDGRSREVLLKRKATELDEQEAVQIPQSLTGLQKEKRSEKGVQLEEAANNSAIEMISPVEKDKTAAANERDTLVVEELKLLKEDMAFVKKNFQEVLLLKKDQDNGDEAIVAFTKSSSENSNSMMERERIHEFDMLYSSESSDESLMRTKGKREHDPDPLSIHQYCLKRLQNEGAELDDKIAGMNKGKQKAEKRAGRNINIKKFFVSSIWPTNKGAGICSSTDVLSPHQVLVPRRHSVTSANTSVLSPPFRPPPSTHPTSPVRPLPLVGGKPPVIKIPISLSSKSKVSTTNASLHLHPKPNQL